MIYAIKGALPNFTTGGLEPPTLQLTIAGPDPRMTRHTLITKGGLEPPTQCAHVRARKRIIL
jgi:hypothetical protein